MAQGMMGSVGGMVRLLVSANSVTLPSTVVAHIRFAVRA